MSKRSLFKPLGIEHLVTSQDNWKPSLKGREGNVSGGKFGDGILDRMLGSLTDMTICND